MRRREVFGWAVMGTAWTFWVNPRAAKAAGWADRLFSESAHDFGPVPRGAKVRHNFVLTNRTGEAITIVNVHASCGCTTGRALASLVPPGQSAVVEAEMDTRNFVGRKSTVLYVSVVTAGGRAGEAGLGVSSMILSDIVLNPGAIDFGTVARGQTPSQLVQIDRVGLPDWRVSRIVSNCKAIDAILQETARSGAAVGYRLTVTLRADAPAGTFRDEIRLVSNDRESPSFPIQLGGTVRSDLTASPAVLSLGRTASSGSLQGRYLVRASKPFMVKGVEGSGDGFKIEADDATAKAVHILTVTYKPEDGTTRGDLRRSFQVATDLPGEPPLTLTAMLHADP